MNSTQRFSDANNTLSLSAMEYACDLTLLGINNIQERLYAYGRIPVCEYWIKKFPSDEKMSEVLIGGDETLAATLLHSAWIERQPPVNNNRWRIFHNRNFRGTVSGSLSFKLYVNLHPDSLAAEFGNIIHHLTMYNVPVFKFSKDVYNVVRPDKFVAYLGSFDTLLALARALSTSLQSSKVQQLPFTAAIDSTGVISCGFDPPKQIADRFKTPSWRSFITRMIVDSLAEGAKLKMEKDVLIKYSTSKINAMGIDTKKWLPKNLM